MIVLCALVVVWFLEEIYEENLLSEVKVTVTRSLPDQEALRRRDGHIIHENMDHLHLNQEVSKKDHAGKSPDSFILKV